MYATGAQKSFVVAASLVSGSAGALIINNRKTDENATSLKLIIDTSTNLRRAEKSESGDAQDQTNKLTPILNTDLARNTPEYYFNSAHEKYESGNYEDALDDCISALKIDSKHVKAIMDDRQGSYINYKETLGITTKQRLLSATQGFAKIESRSTRR